MTTRWALRITWRDGGEEYLVDVRRPSRPIKAFETPQAARAHREQLLTRGRSEVGGIDVVPYPKGQGAEEE